MGLLHYWNGINRQENSAERLPDDFLTSLKNRAITVTKLISPDDFDPDSPQPLKLKNAIVHALPSSEAGAHTLGAKDDGTLDVLLPLGLPSSRQAPQLPSREAVEASGRR